MDSAESTPTRQLTLGWAADEKPAEPEAQMAPMLRHYLELKKQYADYLLLYQVGDFYEVFFDDARTVSEALDIRLTSRDKTNPNPVPMCGVPQHAIDNYLPRLLAKGYSAVLISQADEDKGKKGGMRREVSRIVTPGVRFEGDGLDERSHNYLCAGLFGAGGGSLAVVDVSTGHLRLLECETWEDFEEHLDRIRPSEMLLPMSLETGPVDERSLTAVRKKIAQWQARCVERPFRHVRAKDLVIRLEQLLPQGLNGSMQQLSLESIAACAALLNYVDEVSCGRPPQLSECTVSERRAGVVLDAATRRNLEIVETRSEAGRQHSLLAQIDCAVTAMGSRQLSDWLLAPSTNLPEMTSRHDAVQELVEQQAVRLRLRASLQGVRDIERICSRVTSQRATPKDLAALGESLRVLPEIRETAKTLKADCLAPLHDLDTLEEIAETLDRALAADPPFRINEGGIFRGGYSAALDDLWSIAQDGQSWFAALETREREATGIPGLKVRYNNVFGYSIEISKAHLAKVPDRFERRQTLTNAERFVTPELKDFEYRILASKSRQIELEKELFIELRNTVSANAGRIQKTAHRLAQLDGIAGFAELASRQAYCRPVMSEEGAMKITGGRHPVVERVLGRHRFVPNETLLDNGNRRFAVLTGPNMGGKSTYLRQIGLIQLLAQAGSFVPAAAAELPIVDRIFTRIGAADDLARGDSTFMVEMKEAAVIVRKATSRSLVLIDEIGRGTATTDGLAIATAVAEWLHDQVRCKTVFATHFHELTGLTVREGVFCLSVGVVEHDDVIEFTHRIEERPGDRSYGIEVAKLAGLPAALIERAAELLRCPAEPTVVLREPEAQRPRASLEHQPVIEELRSLDADALTPLQALQYLGRFQRLLRGNSD